MPKNLQVVDNKKYVWDGKEYANEGDAQNAAAEYKKVNFEIQLIKEDGKDFVYTRRVAVPAVVKEI